MQSTKIRTTFVLTQRSANKIWTRSVSATALDKVDIAENFPLKSWKEIPGPRSLPMIGPLLQFLPGGTLYKLNGLRLTNKLYELYGPIVRIDAFIGRNPLVFLFDAESTSQVLRGENCLPIRPGFETLDYYRKNVKKGVEKGKPTGLITDHGELWKEFRSVVNPVLLQTKTIKLYASALDEVAMDVINRIKSKRDEKNMIKGQFDKEINLWSLESIGVVALGSRLGCLDPNLPKDSPAMELINCIKDLFKIAGKLDLSPTLWKLVSTPNFKKAMALYEQQEMISKHFINKSMQEIKTKNKSDDEKGVLEKLLEINEDFAYVIASDLLFAGIDTASNAIIATLYLLAVNPEKQAKLRKELRSNQEKKAYLKACLKESLRMMPVTLGNVRVTTKEYNLMGYRIPPNTRVIFAHQNMSLMEEHYIRSKEYIPERWLVGKEDPLYYKQAHPFAQNPFGFGVRSCIGRRIAELEMETFIAMFVENFEIEWFGPPPKVDQTSINYVKGPFNFIFKDASK